MIQIVQVVYRWDLSIYRGLSRSLNGDLMCQMCRSLNGNLMCQMCGSLNGDLICQMCRKRGSLAAAKADAMIYQSILRGHSVAKYHL